MEEISITTIIDLLVTLPIFAAFLTELAAVKAKPPTNTSSGCTWTVHSLSSPVL